MISATRRDSGDCAGMHVSELSKEIFRSSTFREPGVKYRLFFRAVEPRGRLRGRVTVGDPRERVALPFLRVAAGWSPAATASRRVDLRTPPNAGSISQSGSSIHSPTSCSARKSAVDRHDLCVEHPRPVGTSRRTPGRRNRAVDGVVRARQARAHDPVGEVARVDHLGVRRGGRGGEHAAAIGEPLPAGRRSDRSGPTGRRSARAAVMNAFAKRSRTTSSQSRLQLAVATSCHSSVGSFNSGDRDVSVGRRRRVRVDGDRRHEGVVPDVAERIHRSPTMRGTKSPASMSESNSRPRTASRWRSRLPRSFSMSGRGPAALAAVEHRHFVAARERGVDRVAAEELCAAENQDVHRLEVEWPRSGT